MRILQLSVLLLGTSAWAGEQVGTLTLIEGDVKLFTHPSRTAFTGPQPHARFDDTNYSVRDAALGDRVERDNVVRTLPGSKARVVFDNGDHVNVAPATSFRIGWDKDTAQGKTKVNLLYGKLRGVVRPGGPRSRLRIQTRSAVMGVRGTDFFVADDPATGTEVAVLRGKVEVESLQAGSAPPTAVESGFKGVISAPQAAQSPIEVTQVSQPELELIRDTSSIQPSEAVPAANADAAPALERVQALEKAAVQATIDDLKAENPDLYRKMTEAPPRSPDEVNRLSMGELIAKAPAQTEKPGAIVAKLDDTAPARSVEPAPTPSAEPVAHPHGARLWLAAYAGNSKAQLDSYNSGRSLERTGTTAGFEADYRLGSGRWGLVATFFPLFSEGGEIDRNFQPNRHVQVDVKYMMFAVAPRVTFAPFGKLEVRALLGPRLAKLVSARAGAGPDSDSVMLVDSEQDFRSETLGMQLGVSLSYRLLSRVKLRAEFRHDSPMENVGSLSGPVQLNVKTKASAAMLGVAVGL